MADVGILARTLEENLSWNKARIDFIAKFIIALIQVRTVNLTEIANVLEGKAATASNYKRIQRFLSGYELKYAEIAVFIVRLINQSKPCILTLDRTNWKFGEKNINILVLGIVYRGVAIPIFWKLLNKRGNSNTEERIEIIENYIRTLGKASIQYLCGDREFVGEQWLKYLHDEKIDFRIRIKENTKVPNAHGQMRNAWRLFSFVKTNEAIVFDKTRLIWGIPLYFSGLRMKTGEYLIIVSLRYSQHPLDDYKNRWEIETLFACFKSRGFNLEDTHITEPDRINKLIAVLAITLCWCHLVGEWIAARSPIKIKKHGRLAKSIFRLGLDFLQNLLINFQSHIFSIVCEFLSCT